MVPSLIEEAFGREALPYWMQKNDLGLIFYMTILAVSLLFDNPLQFCILLPLSIPREFGSITYLSALGLMSNVFIMFAVTFEFFTNKRVVKNFEMKFRAAQWLILKWDSIIEVIPFIVFLYMYQNLIP